ncbi:MAG: AAA family ATPase [Thermomicrobiales bacterium]
MRIAVSGTHITGKSTLVAALAERLPRHVAVAEPYEILAGRGYEFADPPDIDDFVVQLRQSLLSLRRSAPNLIFDRCPLDFLGYIAADPDAVAFEIERWREPVSRAMASLDLVIALTADRAYDPPIDADEAAYRRDVDDRLRDIVVGDAYDLGDGVEILALDGPWDRRVETVLAHVHRRNLLLG